MKTCRAVIEKQLSRMFSGRIIVDILSASNLPTTESVSPYVLVKVDKEEGLKTKTNKETLNPVWNEQKEIYKENAMILYFSVNDEKVAKPIAECTLSISNLLIEQVGRDSIQLTQPLVPQGELHLQIVLKENEKTNTLQRRQAVEKIYRVRGHNFKKIFFPSPTFCARCKEFIWGVGKQGMKCTGCQMVCHKRCHKLILPQCSVACMSHGPDGSCRSSPHEFVKNTYLSPTFCDHDGTLLVGLVNQGYKCKNCNLNVHKQCMDHVPATCGINKLAMALTLIPTSPDIVDRESMEKSEEEMELIRREILTKIKQNMKIILSEKVDNSPEIQEIQKSKLEDFRMIKTIGKGAFGKVILVEHKEEGKIYALKAVHKAELVLNDDVQIAFSERNILALGSQNRFLVKLHSSFQNADYIFFAMEYLDGGDLMFHLLRTGLFTEDRARFYTAELILALQFLHLNGIIYRDLKLENVMLTSEGHVKLADFGMTKENLKDGATTNTFCGTPNYIAPEMLNGQPYGFSVDYWTLGILLYQMMSGRNPFDHSDVEMLYRIIQYRQVHIPPSFSEGAQDFIRGLLEKNPKHRLGCNERSKNLRDHVFFHEITWTDLEQGKMTPPFQPVVGGAEEASNFDAQFTHQSPDLAQPRIKQDIRKIADECFKEFSFYNNKL